jgi:hypothetical protein
LLPALLSGVENEMKRRSKCKKWKAEVKFYRRRRHKDGLAARRKECADEAIKKARKK